MPVPNKRGRPPLHKSERKSKNRTFRLRGGLDEWLKELAAKSGRSVSEEIELQLQMARERRKTFVTCRCPFQDAV